MVVCATMPTFWLLSFERERQFGTQLLNLGTFALQSIVTRFKYISIYIYTIC